MPADFHGKVSPPKVRPRMMRVEEITNSVLPSQSIRFNLAFRLPSGTLRRMNTRTKAMEMPAIGTASRPKYRGAAHEEIS